MRRWTIAILLATTALLVAWDIVAYLQQGTPATISDVVLDFARQHPALPFALGVICGHLLWPQRVRDG